MALLAFYYRIIFYTIEYAKHTQQLKQILQTLRGVERRPQQEEVDAYSEIEYSSEAYAHFVRQLEKTEDKFLTIYTLEILTSLAKVLKKVTSLSSI